MLRAFSGPLTAGVSCGACVTAHQTPDYTLKVETHLVGSQMASASGSIAAQDRLQVVSGPHSSRRRRSAVGSWHAAV